MAHKNYKICKNCVMDTTDPQIIFDNNGLCDHCNNFYEHTLPNWQNDENGLKKLYKKAEEIKKSNKNKDFDCIIGMSGGIDSSYLTYIVKDQLNLRPLVFHVDAGWNSDIAVNNIERIVDGLNLDLFTEVINWNEMKDLQLSFFKSGVSHIDAPQDHAFFATMYKFATKYKVNNILTGANLSTECVRNPLDWMYYQSDSIQLRDIQSRYGTLSLETFPLTSILWHKVLLPFFYKIKVLRPLNYINYIKEDAKNTLVNKFKWEPYAQKHFESRFTKFYESYWLPERFGYDVRKVQYSSLILTNQMKRREALQMLEEPSYNKETIDRDIDFVCNKLEINRSTFNDYFNLPIKKYSDYKNQKYIYDIGAFFMKILKLEIGGKR